MISKMFEYLGVVALSFCCLIAPWRTIQAAEGMTPISELARLNLAGLGFELTAEQIFNPQANCVVDGICRVNGCTGSFISANGLIITNHHCAYGAIQSASTTEHDYLADGFQAKAWGDELPAKGYTVRITESYSDISGQVLSAVTAGMSSLERTRAIERRRKELEQQAETANPGMRAEVAEMFAGKTYGLFLYTYLKDVRLVFAPPAAIGNFGGELDNWEWPRHTGDFSLLRAYTAPDGSSADYATENIPYKPKRVIPVSSQGVDEGDFVFLLGYPGRTARHKTASFLSYEESVRLPFIVQLYQWQIATMEAAGKDDRGVALKHASQIRSLANVEKRARGQLKGLKQKAIVASRQVEESQLLDFIRREPEREQKYGRVLSDISAVYADMTSNADFELNFDNLTSASRSLGIAFTLYDAAVERQKTDLEREPAYMQRNFDQTLKTLMLQVHDLHLPSEQVLLSGMLERLADVPRAQQLPPLKSVFQAGISAQVAAWLAKTELADEQFVEKCSQLTPKELLSTGDPLIQWVAQLYPTFLELRQLGKDRSGKLDKAYGDLIEVKQQFISQQFIPDANGTLRLTHGRIKAYSPQDGILKTPITTLRGVIEKTTGEEPYVTPAPVLEKFAAKQFDSFIHPRLQQVPVAILYDTDTTGGNSGSPILNARGELVGVNFDRAFEATINDFAWNADYSRSIGVDIRYCLWITGTVYGADHLLQEMGVAKP